MKKSIVVIAERLRAARLAAQLTESELATKAKLKTAYVSEIEAGHDNLTMPAFLRWCQALKLDPSKVLARLDREDRR